jgi:hypothetical protein
VARLIAFYAPKLCERVVEHLFGRVAAESGSRNDSGAPFLVHSAAGAVRYPYPCGPAVAIAPSRRPLRYRGV